MWFEKVLDLLYQSFRKDSFGYLWHLWLLFSLRFLVVYYLQITRGFGWFFEFQKTPLFIPCVFSFNCIGTSFWHLCRLSTVRLQSMMFSATFAREARRQKMQFRTGDELMKKCLQDVSFMKCQYGRDFFVTWARFEVKTLLRVCFMFRTYLRECHASHNTKETTMLTSNERKIYKVQWNLISICFSNSFCISRIFSVLRGASHGTRFSQWLSLYQSGPRRLRAGKPQRTQDAKNRILLLTSRLLNFLTFGFLTFIIFIDFIPFVAFMHFFGSIHFTCCTRFTHVIWSTAYFTAAFHSQHFMVHCLYLPGPTTHAVENYDSLVENTSVFSLRSKKALNPQRNQRSCCHTKRDIGKR